MSESLPAIEVKFYQFSWFISVCYSLYRIYLIGNEANKSHFTFSFIIGPGWSFLNRLKDHGDYEWELWMNFMYKNLAIFVLVNYIVAYIIRYVNAKILPFWYFLNTSICLVWFYGYRSYVILLLQPISFIILLKFKKHDILTMILCCILYHFSSHSRFILYLQAKWDYNAEQNLAYLMYPLVFVFASFIRKSKLLIWFFFYNIYYIFCYTDIFPFEANQRDISILSPTIMWIYLRCISFSLDEINNKSLSIESIYIFFGYVFHMPCFFLGPIFLYETFKKQVFAPTITMKSVWYLLVNNARYLFWMFMMEILHHFLYVNYILRDLAFYMKKDDSFWIVFGAAACLGIFFFLKYTVLYGFSLTWARAEGYDVPNPPKCVARISSYADMWRLFDEGLYLFIKKYIYRPSATQINIYLSSLYTTQKVVNVATRIVSSTLCFFFVFLWHGLERWILVWTMLNLTIVVSEMIAKEISKSSSMYFKLKTKLGPRNEKRFIAIIAAPLTIVSIISNFYFLGGHDIGEYYFNYIFCDKLSNTLYMWFFAHCLCHVSMEFKRKIRNN